MKGLRKLLVSLFLVAFLAATIAPIAFAQGSEPPIPPVTVNGNYVLDQLNWLTPEQEADINAIVSELDTHNMAEIAVVTQNDCGSDSQTYRNTFFRTWGIGHKEKNDGLLILVCWYDGDKDRRKIEQEVGYGLEGMIPDLLTSKMVDTYFIPAFKADKPGDGLVNMVKAYDSVIRGNTPEELVDKPQPSSSDILLYGTFLGLRCIWWVIILIIILIIAYIWAVQNGYIDPSSSSYSGGSSYSGSSRSSGSRSSGGSSFGGGSSGGGGSSRGF